VSETTVSEVVTWAAKSAAMKTFLRISGTDDDAFLQAVLPAAAEMADAYLERTFTYTAPETADDAIPTNVELGCYAYAGAVLDWSERDLSITMAKTAQLQESYANPAQVQAAAVALKAARIYWDPWKNEPALASGLP
jgi:hypothetical protein